MTKLQKIVAAGIGCFVFGGIIAAIGIGSPIPYMIVASVIWRAFKSV